METEDSFCTGVTTALLIRLTQAAGQMFEGGCWTVAFTVVLSRPAGEDDGNGEEVGEI